MSREMVDSGFAWMGNIPADWSMTRIQTQLCEINEKNNPVRVSDVLSLTNTRGVIPYEDKGNVGNKSKENVEDYKIAYPDTIVANSMNILIGSVGYCKYYGCVSPVYYVFAPTKCANIHFMDYFMSMTAFQKELRRNANGILEIRMRVSVADILKKKMALPSMDEQRQIVSFLDRKCSAIDTAIEKTKKSIEKLEEYKKAVITKAVTKGLDPDAKMKDSGIEGLGMIPDTWSVCPMKTLFSFGKGLSITKDDLTENGKPVLSYGQIHSKTNPKVSTPDELLRYVPEDKAKIQSLTSIGDFIFADTSEDRDGCGNCNYIDTEGIYAGYHTIIAKAKGITDNKYFGYLFGTDAWRFQMRRELTEVKLYSVSQKVLKNTVILLPTDSDRNRIVTFLDKKCKSIDTLISKKVETISKWEEYKKSLIYYAVTGKIDCRNEAV